MLIMAKHLKILPNLPFWYNLKISPYLPIWYNSDFNDFTQKYNFYKLFGNFKVNREEKYATYV